ncbi:MAG: PQQ-binding-like beta-propeller repeat protein [bacterium]
MVADEESIYFGAADNTLYRASQNSGKITASHATERIPVGRQTLSSNDIFVFLSQDIIMGQGQGRGEILLAMDKSLSQIRWQLEPDFKWTATKSYLWNQFLLTGTEYGEVIAYVTDNGSEKWRVQTSGAVRSIGRNGNTLFVGTLEGYVFAVKVGK